VFEQLAKISIESPAFAERNAFVTLSLLVSCDDEPWTVRIDRGIVAVTRGQSGTHDLRLISSRSNWEHYASPNPPRGFTAIAAMQRIGALTVEGDMLAFHRHQFSIEEMFGMLRPRLSAGATTTPTPSSPSVEPVVGRYLNLSLQGRPHRIYFEDAGSGIPLLCLHTAGSDARQYRALLNDEQICRTYRVLAFDMPWHGKSSPPEGYEREVYRLTVATYIEAIVAVSAALKLDRPVVMGCSIGGRVVLQLGLRHPRLFRAGIGLQTGCDADVGFSNAFRSLKVGHRPDVDPSTASAARVAPLIAPTAPRRDAWETLWHYMQAGPGVFDGDTDYYFDTGTVTDAELATLKATGFPLYFLTGDYDLGVTPAATRRVANAVGARSFQVMTGLGHFPMSEDPLRFRHYLMPILDSILELAAEKDPAYS
jgi:pimeloyl-ACP methyl ester carboxylesterase